MQHSEAWKDETRERMWELHPVERLSALALTCVQCNPRDTRAAIKGLIAMAEMMAKVHNAQTRSSISEDMRDAADRVEQPMALVR